MKIEDVKALVDLVSERNIAELELEEEGMKLKIRKATALPQGPVSPAVVGTQEASDTGEPKPSSAATEPSLPAQDGLAYVMSPMVGTFYRQPEPGADPFAREGEYVSKGQVLCVIEAMKLMNEIESEFHGELVKALVENGQPVQFGDPLFAIREM